MGFNAVTGDFSRGAGGFWIENGELAYPVSEVTSYALRPKRILSFSRAASVALVVAAARPLRRRSESRTPFLAP